MRKHQRRREAKEAKEIVGVEIEQARRHNESFVELLERASGGCSNLA